MAASTVSVLSCAFTSSGWGPKQEVLVVCTHLDQLQVSIWCQGQVADTPVVVGARTDSQGRGQLQAHWQLHYPGCLCTFTLLYNLPLGMSTAVEASDVHYNPPS